MVIRENRLEFSFPDDTLAIKYDDTLFYRNRYGKIPNSKGVDILALAPTTTYIIEVKDCSETAESQDKWRRSFSETEGMNKLVEEIALKVAHTCAALMGVSTFRDQCEAAAKLEPIAESLTDGCIAQCERKLLVILHLEGDFSCRTRPTSAIFRDLKVRLQRKLHWLNCNVDVVNSSTSRSRDYAVGLVVSSPADA